MKKIFLTSVLAGATLLLSACNTAYRLVDNTVQFPDVSGAWKPEGVVINPERLALLKPGVTKKQVYDILGVPHYNYGLIDQFNEPYWDYILSVKTSMGEVPCQLVIEWVQPAIRLKAPIKALHWKDPTMCAQFVN